MGEGRNGDGEIIDNNNIILRIGGLLPARGGQARLAVTIPGDGYSFTHLHISEFAHYHWAIDLCWLLTAAAYYRSQLAVN